MNPAMPEASLTSLMHLLAEQALLALGVPHPLMKELPPPNPAAARFYIDLIGVLKEKTAAARTPEESSELEEVLYQLRMRAMDLKPQADAPQAPQS